jgi:hypothetical protein
MSGAMTPPPILLHGMVLKLSTGALPLPLPHDRALKILNMKQCHNKLTHIKYLENSSKSKCRIGITLCKIKY